MRHVRPDDIDELQRLVQAMDEAEDADRWSDLIYLLHSAMYRVARLPQYASAAFRVLTLIEQYSRVAVNRLEAQPDAQREHHEMIDALRRGSVEDLREVLERSSLRARKLLVDFAEGKTDARASVGPTAGAARAVASTRLPRPRLTVTRGHGCLTPEPSAVYSGCQEGIVGRRGAMKRIACRDERLTSSRIGDVLVGVAPRLVEPTRPFGAPGDPSAA